MTTESRPLLSPKDLIAEPGFKPTWKENVSDEDYHADKTAVGSSGLRQLLESPRSFYHHHFLGKEVREKDSLRIGKIIHMAILEPDKFRSFYIVEPKFIGKTKDGRDSEQSAAAKKLKSDWYERLDPNAVVVSSEELSMIIAVAEAIKEHPQGLDIMKNVSTEVAGWYADPETGIRMKVKIDIWGKSGLKLVDLKSTRSAKYHLFGSDAFKHRYDIQLFQYGTGAQLITGKWPELNMILAVEKNEIAPEVAAYYFDKEDLGQAEHDYRRALRLLRKCIDEDRWPMRQRQIERIYTPQWFINQSMDEGGYYAE